MEPMSRFPFTSLRAAVAAPCDEENRNALVSGNNLVD
jgi:hypothetical protein